jgi:ABC-type iron transport system FetAB ATPase subunit
MDSTKPCLSARDIVFIRDGRHILDGASIDVSAGTIATIDGASGSGKSTFLRVIATLIEPDRGSVFLAGVDVGTLAPSVYRRRVGYVAQAPQMLEGTLADNVRAGPRFAGRDLDDAAVAALLSRVALDPTMAGRSARELSGGERLRVALARTLANEPEAILLDEPTAALDPEAAARILELVRSLAESGVAAVVVTHAPSDASTLGGTHWTCKAGRLERAEARG